MRDHYRPVDLARAVGVSVATVRLYERLGFLPAAERSASGHRRYRHRHLRALEAARAMMAGYGWEYAKRVMQAVHRGDTAGVLALVDARHAQLDRGRREVEETVAALRAVTEGAIGSPRRSERLGQTRVLRVGEAAQRVGVRVSSLRFWEQQGLLRPARDSESGYRLYDEEQMRRLRVVVVLRNGGYGFDAIRSVLDELGEGRPETALAAVQRRADELTESSHRCVQATAMLWGYLSETSGNE